MSKHFIVFFLLVFIHTPIFSQEIIPLYSGAIPNQTETHEEEIITDTDIIRIENVQKPTLEVYLPSKRGGNGKAMIICPGGGYQVLAYDWEGTEIAKWLNSKGIAAFVLKYRLPVSKSIIAADKAPLQDSQRAMQVVRHNAEKWNIEKDQIGVIGFSAGGHLAASLATHFNDIDESSDMEFSDVSARPDFLALIYPVVTLSTPYTHMGSRNNLLGDNADQTLVDYYSSELHVNMDTPPTFLVHASNDKAVPVENSILFYEALRKEGVYSEMHIYPEGGHGFGLAIGKGHLQGWTDCLGEWLDSLK